MASSENLVLGIDAANIRGGGGLTHLRGILSAVDPAESGISKIVVWSGHRTVSLVPERRWLELVTVPDLDGGLCQRTNWQRRRLDRCAVTASCDALLIPGGAYLGRFKPVVVICQNLLPFCPGERARFGLSWTRLRYHLLEWVQSQTLRSATGVIFLSESARQIVLGRLGQDLAKTAIIRHGIEERFRREPRAPMALSAYSREKPFRWLYVSIINWYKHQATVAEAAARLRRNGLPLKIDFVGPAHPPALRRLVKVIRHLDPVGSFLKYHPAASGVALERWYHQADGFIFASSCENMPIILMEAMAAALPIACSRVPPMPEILRDAGGYFDPESPVELANLLLRFMKDPEWRAMCARRAVVRSQEFSWEKCARATFDFVAQVSARAPKSVVDYETSPARTR